MSPSVSHVICTSVPFVEFPERDRGPHKAHESMEHERAGTGLPVLTIYNQSNARAWVSAPREIAVGVQDHR